MYYPEELVEEVRERNDIVDVIGSYVKLQKRGANHMGLCPFHNEKSPSFSVSGSKQMYHCFGCGVGGNVFTFLMEYENYTFVEALKVLGDRAGVKLPELEYSEEAKKAADLKTRVLELYKEAGKYYYYQLRSKQGEEALAYLRNRGLSEEIITKFGLGYSTKYSDDLYQYMKKAGYEDSLLRQSGLFTMEESKGAYDKFWNRVMFPIMDGNNKVIAFGGRVMGDGVPKYLNSPETIVFDKSRNLFGLNFARTSRKDYFLICEGYMDVIALHQAGFQNAVASLGTAFTPQQARLLSRYTKEAYLTYDSDGAGVAAAIRAIPILKEAGLSAKVIDMKPYKDPDEFIKALGAEEYQNRIDQAMNSFFFEISVLERDYDLGDPEQKTKFFNEMAKKLLIFTEEIERNNYIEALSRKYNVSYDNLRKLVNRYGAQMTVVNVAKETRDREKEQNAKKGKPEEGMQKSQKILLTWLIDDSKAFDQIRGIITADDFTEELYREVANMVFEQYESEHKVTPAKIINRFESKELQTEVAGLFSTSIQLEMTEAERRKLFADTVVRVKRASLDIAYKKAIEDNDIMALQNVMKEQHGLEKLHSSLNHG
ncbi:DNA primase [Lachnoclostridium phytofermentans]|uniref:DNA primase n=1 Tax=Lachnoclostridium phytofermentans (strain ATCC 700394 / DSM 18823 / ISDg) TaxID=357809 RepID=A9KI24_LACP7|nr:DNA primase [Lachnoclostridium phytofermentans]ABX43871.1 DNA primase [Lachnoclostridium phytofermentans ISDg]